MSTNKKITVKRSFFSKHKTKIRIVLILVWLILAGLTTFYIWKKFFQPQIITTTVDGVTITVDETPITQEQKDEYTVPASYPRYISIPSLNINKARVVQIGIIKNTNQLDSPISIHDAGWYTASAKPGVDAGAILMDGHNGGPNYGGIFEKLGNLAVGEKIIIERGDGEIFTYKVRDNRQMKLSEINDPSNKYGMSTMLESIESGKEGLNIITCVGNWIQDSQTFDSRVMLRAVRV
jgi:sortase (surface protein transpeptidase)